MNEQELDGRCNREVWLRHPETGRKRLYRVDSGLDEGVLQQLNSLAFLYGVDCVSVCAGHAELTEWEAHLVNGAPPDYSNINDPGFADVRFSIVYPREDRLEAHRARILAAHLAGVLDGPQTFVHISVLDDANYWRTWHKPRPLYQRRFVIARHTCDINASPDAARSWWNEIVARMDLGAGAPSLESAA